LRRRRRQLGWQARVAQLVSRAGAGRARTTPTTKASTVGRQSLQAALQQAQLRVRRIPIRDDVRGLLPVAAAASAAAAGATKPTTTTTSTPQSPPAPMKTAARKFRM